MPGRATSCLCCLKSEPHLREPGIRTTKAPCATDVNPKYRSGSDFGAAYYAQGKCRRPRMLGGTLISFERGPGVLKARSPQGSCILLVATSANFRGARELGATGKWPSTWSRQRRGPSALGSPSVRPSQQPQRRRRPPGTPTPRAKPRRRSFPPTEARRATCAAVAVMSRRCRRTTNAAGAAAN